MLRGRSEPPSQEGQERAKHPRSCPEKGAFLGQLNASGAKWGMQWASKGAWSAQALSHTLRGVTAAYSLLASSLDIHAAGRASWAPQKSWISQASTLSRPLPAQPL